MTRIDNKGSSIWSRDALGLWLSIRLLSIKDLPHARPECPVIVGTVRSIKGDMLEGEAALFVDTPHGSLMAESYQLTPLTA